MAERLHSCAFEHHLWKSEELHELVLRRIRVLKLVHEDVAVSTPVFAYDSLRRGTAL